MAKQPAKKTATSPKKTTAAKKTGKNISSPPLFTAAAFMDRLETLRSMSERKKVQGFFKSGEGEYGDGDEFMGVKMGQLFALAKEFIDMTPAEIETLLESHLHEARAGAVSIMDFQARSKKITTTRRKELFDLYINRHDRINNWDLVDRSAPYVVGGYLADKPRAILYKLARSKNMWERRTAIVATFFFIRQGDVNDTFKIGALLVHDKEDLVQKAAGGWVRHAGTKDPKQLLTFLDKHAAAMPRTALRYAIEHLDKKKREHYMSLGKPKTKST
ncbi:DNA alkylation repair protein [Chryseolinea lacunae]|uniref:DNA alkylation repair protein n=1 Tax=Chryseolinea lacunae TaxID=2801331 RepID=A0ABS1KLA5_9BACT|nr:DNA alkylation repair protein [Chryseolinea lacunae]MBL0740022.1 DNA alkylation repair protein [Chryseolinea lacunae]